MRRSGGLSTRGLTPFRQPDPEFGVINQPHPPVPTPARNLCRREPLLQIRVLAQFANRTTRKAIKLVYLPRPERDGSRKVATLAAT